MIYTNIEHSQKGHPPQAHTVQFTNVTTSTKVETHCAQSKCWPCPGSIWISKFLSFLYIEFHVSHVLVASCYMLHLIAAVCAFTPTFSDPWMSFWYLEFQSWLCSALTVLYNLQLRTGPQVLRAPQQQLFEQPRLARCKWLFAVHKFTAWP